MIWQLGFEIAIQAYKLIETFPKTERYSLSNQITNAAISIASNIAEGNSRSSEKDKCRFIEIALGSSFELETQILISQALNFGDKDIREALLKSIESENRMLHSFISTLKK